MVTLSIVIPVYNAEGAIELLCDAVINALTPLCRLQIVLVNDGSRDGSCEACQRLCERYPKVVDYVSLTRNFGEHNAVMAGLHYAEGDYCVIMDDDFQNPPLEVIKLVEKIKEGYDVVYTRYAAKMHSGFRNIGSRLHNWMATRVLDKPADLYLSSFKILSRFLVQQVVQYTGPDPYLDAMILRITRNIGVVTVQHEPRAEGKSGYTFGKLLSLWGNMVAAFSIYPLRLISILGAVMAVTGTVVGAWTLLSWVVPDNIIHDPDNFQTLNASNWFFRGLTLLVLGIIGEYVGRICMHMNCDPQFVVRETRLRHGEDGVARSGRLALVESAALPQQRPRE